MLKKPSLWKLIPTVVAFVLIFGSISIIGVGNISGSRENEISGGGFESNELSEVYVEVGDNYFDPDELEVEPGQTIVFENVGNVDHTVTIEGTEYDEIISPGETVTVVIEEEGVYDLDCTLHAGQDGTIAVGEELPEDDEIPGFTLIGFLGIIIALTLILLIYNKREN